MEESFLFLNLEGLDDGQVKQLRALLHPANLNTDIEFPWNDCYNDEKFLTKANMSSLNVHAPAFEAFVPACLATTESIESHNSQYSNGSTIPENAPIADAHYYAPETQAFPVHQPYVNSPPVLQSVFNNQCAPFSQPPKPFIKNYYPKTSPDKNNYPQPPPPVSSFKLNPTVSSFVPQNIDNYPQTQKPLNGPEAEPEEEDVLEENKSKVKSKDGETEVHQSEPPPNDLVGEVSKKGPKEPEQAKVVEPAPVVVKNGVETEEVQQNNPSKAFSWADVVSRGQKPAPKVSPTKTTDGDKSVKTPNKDQENEEQSIEEDLMALSLGKHLYELKLDFQPILLQPRGLINRRNWCYINATLQALLACPPFYTLVRNLPLGPCVERGKSSTPVIDSMVKVAYEFLQIDKSQEDLQVGQPFQPDFIYDMLKDLKSDCLKGQQEDAEEFLSFILNGMHEEMVKIIRNYEKKNHLDLENEAKENGDVSDGEDEWQVIGSKHKGMVTRKVAEHKTPISDLLGGQIKSLLTTSGNKTSASIQPFFTLQLDIQSDSVTSVSEALKEMTLKEPIQGYTCAKTKQEVEAFSHIALQKLPPILILHLKRFVYNKTGGCKKVLKKTDYPLVLDINRDMFSADVKKSQRHREYKLFAVMYHDGEEAIKGHYISDVYNHGSNTWIRCDDRAISAVTEEQVLSHSPPRVPYLLFYQES